MPDVAPVTKAMSCSNSLSVIVVSWNDAREVRIFGSVAPSGKAVALKISEKRPGRTREMTMIPTTVAGSLPKP
ncbi:MAG: hypothetical protein VW405_13670, partial [Rhodospirillaceae bacterium]